ncbi:Oxidoreductase andH [Hyphodiscus hymeniophilus]|uniref:Oxidoreductase andH n=1 Tax=Hyphodiscus hymeniophilus TaxID=353542 RepID=A0A9P6VDI2_9HELO|nr:Oxidoreductase andH [Hyphodiscus hymeniophilus]
MVQYSTFYILGRSLVFLETEVSLIIFIDAACKNIVDVESKIDFLCMSQGCFPINVPQHTEEGLDLCLVIQYYSRIRLVSILLPLLRASPRGGRILSVLDGGREKPIITTDLGLDNPANYSWS